MQNWFPLDILDGWLSYTTCGKAEIINPEPQCLVAPTSPPDSAAASNAMTRAKAAMAQTTSLGPSDPDHARPPYPYL